jgi:hypothetical protein
VESNLVKDTVEESERAEVIQRMILDVIHRYKYTNVNEVIATLQRTDRSLTVDELRNTIYDMENQRILSLSHTAKPSFFEYLFRLEFNLHLWIIVSLSLAAAAVIYLFPSDTISVVRLVIGGTIIIFMPGYALVNLLFRTREMDYVEQIALSVGLSLAATAVIAMVLNYAPIGVNLDSITLSVISFSIIIAAASTGRFFSLKQESLTANT